VAVSGGPGQLSSCLIPLAKEQGLTIVTDARPRDEDVVRKFGADVVLPRTDAFAEQVRAAYPLGVDAVVDAAVVGASVQAAVRDGGDVIAVRQWTGAPERGINARMILVGPYSKNSGALAGVADALARRVIVPRVAGIYEPSNFAEAYRRFEAGGVRGRLVLDFSADA
jgi:NADPH:quinone reductase